MDLYLNGNDALEVYPEQAWSVAACGIKPQTKKTARLEYGFAAKVANIETEEVVNFPVYCIEVEVDHSLIVNSIAVGNCVGNGGGQAVWYLSAVQAVKKGDIEAKLPFYLHPYGRSRYYSNNNRCQQGEGSWGGAMAKSVKEDGILPFDYPGLPQPDYKGGKGITWGQSNEMNWSSGCAATNDQASAAKKFVVQTTAQVKSSSDVKAALINGYSCTIASDWGGLSSPPVKDGVLLNRRATTWNHQMSILGYWNHPTLGEIFWIMNSWGVDAHGTDPAGGPPGGFWVLKAEIDYITGQDDSYAYSNFAGFPSQKLDWMI
jgi:hypothetical protein